MRERPSTPTDDAPVFEADHALLKRVLGNLVQNAVTHSANEIAQPCCRRAASERGHSSRSRMYGPGIPAEYPEESSSKFERVKNQTMPRTRSSGLGLAFCKLVVDGHGGRIWVQSAGRGEKGAPSTSPLDQAGPIASVRRQAAGGTVEA